MGAGFSLDIAKTGVAFLLNTTIERLQGVLLPDTDGACTFLPKVMDQLQKLNLRKEIDEQLFPGSSMTFSLSERCNWMKQISQVRPIGQIIWPGTHNSATNKIGIKLITRPFGQHQTLSIYRQLVDGVRCLDIRIQQDRRVCNGSILSYGIDCVIGDIKTFLSETQYEIIILEIRTERGYIDPPDFESYLVGQFHSLLIHQDDHVFLKKIVDVLPGRIICVWKPNNSPRPKAGGPIWSKNYLRDDTFDTEMPLTKFVANLNNLKEQSQASERNFFYRVENTLAPQTSNPLEWLLLWPKHVEVVSKRIQSFARHFLAKCYAEGVLDRLQIYSTDFVDVDFINSCIALNHERDILQPSRVPEMTIGKSDSDRNNRSKPMSIATDLSITDDENISRWKWPYVTFTPSSSDVFKAAESLQVRWLSVGGKIKTDMLQLGFKYEVVIVVMLKEDPAIDSDNRWEIPVTIKLTRPDGSKQEHEENLMEKPRGQWIEILAGAFIKKGDQLGDVKFSLLEHGVQTQRMLCIKGVSIQQKDKVEIKPPSGCVTTEFGVIDLFPDSL